MDWLVAIYEIKLGTLFLYPAQPAVYCKFFKCVYAKLLHYYKHMYVCIVMSFLSL